MKSTATGLANIGYFVQQQQQSSQAEDAMDAEDAAEQNEAASA